MQISQKFLMDRDFKSHASRFFFFFRSRNTHPGRTLAPLSARSGHFPPPMQLVPANPPAPATSSLLIVAAERTPPATVLLHFRQRLLRWRSVHRQPGFRLLVFFSGETSLLLSLFGSCDQQQQSYYSILGTL